MPGTEFAVLGRPDDHGESWRELTRVVVPKTHRTPRTLVDAIEPGAGFVPENLLRFSVTFSSAMEGGSAAGHIHLLDEYGAEMPGTLLQMPPELWDREHRRITVLLEPGRIKRGLQPNARAGAPLREGSSVTLVVDPIIRDAAGSPLATGAHRTYHVGPPIRSRVDPNRWQVRWPETPGEPVIVRFDRPLERSLVQRYVRVLDGHGNLVPGRASLGEDALVWVFTGAGTGGDMTLRVDTRLEDIAGNSVRRVFDRDLHRTDDDGIDASEIILRQAWPGASSSDPAAR